MPTREQFSITAPVALAIVTSYFGMIHIGLDRQGAAIVIAAFALGFSILTLAFWIMVGVIQGIAWLWHRWSRPDARENTHEVV